MTKRKIVFFIALLVLSVICGLFSNEPVSAWWKEKESDGKKSQCFAIQYKYVNKRKNSEHLADQGLVEPTSTTAQLSSSYRVCAKVDDNGKVTSKLYFYDPPDTKTIIPLNDDKLKFTLNSDKDALTVSYCPGSVHLCDIGNLEVKKQEFKVSGYGTFKALGEAAWGFAPEKRLNQSKVAFDENDDTESVDKEAEEIDENGGDDDDDSVLSSIKETCANQGGAQSLGWIVCPIMELLGRASGNIYADYVEPSLTVNPRLFSDENQSIKTGWQTFRDIANILFVILLLIVIFSQLTGVGIDNYGIKKILPKLIVVAVLINLSFIICVLAVDISNILGNSFQALFNGLSETLPAAENISVDGEKFIDGSSVQGVLASVGILLAAVTAVGKMWKNPAIVVSMLISAVGVFISIVFLFIMLAVREAAIVVLIVISPVAMVCYMLPNAKKYFDRWFKGFQGLLLVYPICGLMVGGGNYVAKLLMSAGFSQGGFISAFTAMIAGIVPIFFVPMVLKNSFSALGNIGGIISNLGRGASRRATSGMRDSKLNKSLQEMGYNRQRRIDAGLDKNGNLNARGKRRAAWAGSRVGKFLGADTRMARDVEAAKNTIGEQVAAGAALTGALATSGIANTSNELEGSLGKSFGAGTEGAYYGQKYIEAAAKGDMKEMDSILQAMRSSNMKPKDIASLVRHVEANDMNGIKDPGQAAEWRGKMFSQYGNDFLATDAELSHYMKTRGGGSEGDAAREALKAGHGAYAASGAMGIDDIRPEDVKALSGESMAGLASAGLLTQGMAQTVLASNPNVSEDKKIILSATANGNATAAADKSDAAQVAGLAEAIKKDAEALMRDHNATGKVITGTNPDMVNAWVSAVPQNVNVVQNFNAGGSQMQPVDIKIQHTPSPAPSPSSNTPPSRPTTTVEVNNGPRHDIDQSTWD